VPKFIKENIKEFVNKKRAKTIKVLTL